MEQGTVKWFNDAKGLASSAVKRRRRFCTLFRNHIERLQELQEGQAVQFNVIKGPKGW